MGLESAALAQRSSRLDAICLDHYDSLGNRRITEGAIRSGEGKACSLGQLEVCGIVSGEVGTAGK